nr:MAG: putative RNA-dependent RNA polymerase [Narnaviridae sp.]
MDAVPLFSRFPMEDQLSLFVRMKAWPRESFVKFAKYMVAWPMARYLNQLLPERPDGFTGHPLVFSGRIKHLLKGRLVAKNMANIRLWAGYLQGIKRGAAPVSADFIRDAMLDHKKTLSQPPAEVDVATLAEHRSRVDELCRSLKPAKARILEASTSASFESKRSEGGAREYIRSSRPKDELVSFVETRPGVVTEVRGVVPSDFISEALAAAETANDVMVSAVLEPLKVRLITKGSSQRLWVSRFFQRYMWDHLQNFPQFVLTGRTLSPSDLHDLLDREKALGLTFPDWVSGDFKGATDRLSITYTKMAFECFLAKSGLLPVVMDVLRSVLYEQKIHYPASYNKDGRLDPFMQANGQLMGSTLSFPILCVVNLVCYWASLEEYTGRTFQPQELPVLINGDDILFRSDPALYQIWLRNISSVGFVLSLGKNYVHPSVLTINSQIFRFQPQTCSFERAHFYNTGLLTGQSKVTGREATRIAPVWALYNEVVPRAVAPVRAHQRFLHYHLATIRKLTCLGPATTFALGLPFERGGLGFEIPSTVEAYLTSFQRRFATFLEQSFLSSLEQDSPARRPLGLVSDRKPAGLPLHHHPKLCLVPSIGPLQNNYSIFEPPMWTPPALAWSIDSERSELTARHPTSSQMKKFRSQSWARMGSAEITSWPYRVAEITTAESALVDPASIPYESLGSPSQLSKTVRIWRVKASTAHTYPHALNSSVLNSIAADLNPYSDALLEEKCRQTTRRELIDQYRCSSVARDDMSPSRLCPQHRDLQSAPSSWRCEQAEILRGGLSLALNECDTKSTPHLPEYTGYSSF